MTDVREEVRSTPADAVLVDVGRGTGALVVLAPPGRVGSRVDLLGNDGRDRHVDVLERVAFRGVVAAAVFGSVPAGSYEVAIGADVRAPVDVPDGAVAELDLRA